MAKALEMQHRVGLLGRQSCLLTDSAVELTVSSPARLFQCTVPLEYVDPSPIRQSNRPVKCLWVALVVAVIGALFFALTLDPTGDREVRGDFRVMAGLLGIGAAVLIATFFIRKTDLLIFLATDRSVALALPYDRPDPATFKAFVEELRARIERRRTEAAGIAPELAELKRLLDSGRASVADLRRLTDELLGEDHRAGFGP